MRQALQPPRPTPLPFIPLVDSIPPQMAAALLPTLLLTALLLTAGHGLRRAIPSLRTLHIPASVLAGFLGLALLHLTRHLSVSRDIAHTLALWPAPLIAVVFAALLLPPSEDSFATALRRGARSGLFAWIIILGQLLAGLLVYLVAFPKTITPTTAQFLEVSWAGGPGSATAMGALYTSLHFPQGQDIALFLATAGLLYGTFGGLLLVNLGIRRGWTHSQNAPAPLPEAPLPHLPSTPSSRPPVPAPSLPVQLLLLANATALGFLFQVLFVRALAPLPQTIATSLANIPLFLFTLLAGLALRQAITTLKLQSHIHPSTLDRITSLAMDILITAALATLRLDSLSTYAFPILLLIAAGIAWSLITLLLLAPRLLPKHHWFELGLLNFGFSTANTPQGLMLLKIADPHLKSGAAETYAVAAPLTAPFVGGGLLTFTLFPTLLATANLPLLAALLAAITLLLLALAAHLAKKSGEPFKQTGSIPLQPQ